MGWGHEPEATDSNQIRHRWPWIVAIIAAVVVSGGVGATIAVTATGSSDNTADSDGLSYDKCPNSPALFTPCDDYTFSQDEPRDTTTVSSEDLPIETCREFFGDLHEQSMAMGILNLLTREDFLSSKVTTAEHLTIKNLKLQLDALIDSARGSLAAMLRDIQEPLRALLDEHHGDVTLAMPAYKRKFSTMMEACADVGFDVELPQKIMGYGPRYGPGMYLVGKDIKPGTYRSAGPVSNISCAYTIYRAPGKIEVFKTTMGPGIATIPASAYLFQTEGCQPWTPVE